MVLLYNYILNTIGGVVTVIGPGGKPIQVNASSINLTGSPNITPGLPNSSIGASGIFTVFVSLF